MFLVFVLLLDSKILFNPGLVQDFYANGFGISWVSYVHKRASFWMWGMENVVSNVDLLTLTQLLVLTLHHNALPTYVMQ